MMRLATIGAALLLLTACGDDAADTPPAGDGENSARGEVFGGTISDDMIALDTANSQPLSQEEDASDDGAESE